MALHLFHLDFRGTDELFGIRGHYLQHPLGKLCELRLPTGFFHLEFARDIEVEYVFAAPDRVRVMTTVYCLVPALDLPVRVHAFLRTHVPQIFASPRVRVAFTLRVRGLHLRECQRRLPAAMQESSEEEASVVPFDSVCLWYELDPLLLGDSADLVCGEDGSTGTPLRVLEHIDRAFRRHFAPAGVVVTSAISLTYLHPDLLASEPFWNTLGEGFTRTLVHWMTLENQRLPSSSLKPPTTQFHLAYTAAAAAAELPAAAIPPALDVAEREVRARIFRERRAAYRLFASVFQIVRGFVGGGDNGRVELQNDACFRILQFLLPCAAWTNPKLLAQWVARAAYRERVFTRRRIAARAGRTFTSSILELDGTLSPRARAQELAAFSRALDFNALARWTAKTDNAVWWSMFCNRIDDFVYYYAPYVK